MDRHYSRRSCPRAITSPSTRIRSADGSKRLSSGTEPVPLDDTVKSVPGVKLVERSCSSTVVFTTGLKDGGQSVVSWWRSMMLLEKSSFVSQGPKTLPMHSGYSNATSSVMGSLSSSIPTMARCTTINITAKPMWPVLSHHSALSSSTPILHRPRGASSDLIALIRIVSSKPSAATTSQQSTMRTDTSKNRISTNIISALHTPRDLMTFTALRLVSISKTSSALRLRDKSITTRPLLSIIPLSNS